MNFNSLRNLLKLVLVFSLSLFALNPAFADGADKKIKLFGNVAAGTGKAITVGQIEEIGLVNIEAFNPYEEASFAYSGVWLSDIAEHLGGENLSSILTIAIDGYQITFERKEWESMRILVATQVDGNYVGFKEKGPMRIVYPDHDPNQKKYQEVLPKWMWMITEIHFD